MLFFFKVLSIQTIHDLIACFWARRFLKVLDYAVGLEGIGYCSGEFVVDAFTDSVGRHLYASVSAFGWSYEVLVGCNTYKCFIDFHLLIRISISRFSIPLILIFSFLGGFGVELVGFVFYCEIYWAVAGELGEGFGETAFCQVGPGTDCVDCEIYCGIVRHDGEAFATGKIAVSWICNEVFPSYRPEEDVDAVDF